MKRLGWEHLAGISTGAFVGLLFFFVLPVACLKRPDKPVKDKPEPFKLEYHGHGDKAYGQPWFYDLEYKGHSYIFFAESQKGGFLHAAHCQCKSTTTNQPAGER